MKTEKMEVAIPLIESLKKYDEYLNVNHLVNLPSNSPYGNLAINWTEIITRMQPLNDMVIAMYEDFYKIKKRINSGFQFATSEELFMQKFYSEQIIYWLRKTADDILSLVYILIELNEKNQYPKKLKKFPLSDFLKNTGSREHNLKKHIPILNKINEISNSYKHSFINPQIFSKYSKDEPIIISYYLKDNDLSIEPKFYNIYVKDIIAEYDKFLGDAKDLIGSLRK